jgi:hypothetical protein
MTHHSHSEPDHDEDNDIKDEVGATKQNEIDENRVELRYNSETFVRQSSERMSSFCRMLEGAKMLQSIDLHWYKGTSTRARSGPLLEAHKSSEREFHSCLQTLASLPLRSCTLRGLKTTAKVLCDFLNATSAREIMFQRVFLYGGSWTKVFQILTRPKDVYTEIFLDDLSGATGEAGAMIYYNAPGEPKVLRINHNEWPSDLHRQGPEVPQPIDWKFVNGRGLAGNKYFNYLFRSSQQFGPPNSLL